MSCGVGVRCGEGDGVVLTRGHPVVWRGVWRRPDELQPAVAQSLAAVYNFVLSRDTEPAAAAAATAAVTGADVRSRTIAVGGVLCATIGSDCGPRLAALHPHYHHTYGPEALHRYGQL